MGRLRRCRLPRPSRGRHHPWSRPSSTGGILAQLPRHAVAEPGRSQPFQNAGELLTLLDHRLLGFRELGPDCSPPTLRSSAPTGAPLTCTGFPYIMAACPASNGTQPRRRATCRSTASHSRAIKVFDDPQAIESVDPDPDVERFKIVGMSDVGILVVVYAEPAEERIRIISARKANKHEIEEYRQG